MPAPDRSERPLRVALLTTSWPRDANDVAGTFMVQPVERLRAAGVDVRVVSPDNGYRSFGLTGGDGLVANAKRRPWLLPLLLMSMVLGLRRAARDCDLVHGHWLLTAPLAALGGKPMVLTLHGSGSAGRLADLELAKRRPRLTRWLLRRARVVIAVSPPLAEAARGADARAVRMIPHAVDIPEQPADVTSSGTDVTALFVGRLSAEKGVAELVAATRGLDGVRLVVAGDGPERALVPETLGMVPPHELGALHAAADLLIAPSRSEGFGVAVLEAMAAGLPVVATRVGGLAWLAVDEETALVVEPGDVAALRAAVERLRDDPELRARLGAAGRARAEHDFSWARVTQQTIDAYRLALGRPANAESLMHA